MLKALDTRNVVSYCHGNDTLVEMLPHMLEQLEVCQKALSGYLDQKRAAFSRFYFVSDANLLELLSQSSNASAIQPHLQSVFAAVVKMGFEEKAKTRIVELSDTHGETIKLDKPVEMQERPLSPSSHAGRTPRGPPTHPLAAGRATLRSGSPSCSAACSCRSTR